MVHASVSIQLGFQNPNRLQVVPTFEEREPIG